MITQTLLQGGSHYILGLPQGYSPFTPRLGPLHSSVTLGLLRFYSKVGPSSLQCYSDFTPRQLRPSSAATPALLQPYSMTTQRLLAPLLPLSITPKLLRSSSKLSQHLHRGCSGLASHTDFTPEILTARAGPLLSPYSAAPQSLFGTSSGRSLLRAYSEFTQPWKHSGLTPDLLTQLLPPALLSSPLVLSPVLWRYSHFTPGWILFASAPRLLHRYSALLRELGLYSELAQPLLGGYLAFTWRLLSACLEFTLPLLGVYLAFTQRLLSPCSELIQPILGGYSAFTQKLLGLYLEVIRPLLGAYLALTQRLLGLYSEVALPLLKGYSAFTRRLLSLYSEVTQPLLRGYSAPDPDVARALLR